MSVGGDRAALTRLLGGPETAWLLERVRGRIVQADGESLHGVVVLTSPTPAQRTAIVSLVGPPRRPGEALRVELANVEEMLRRGPWPAGLADAVETLTGPVVDRRRTRAEEAAAWERAYATVERAGLRHRGVDRWRQWCLSGGFKRIARAEAVRLGAAQPLDVALDLARGTAAVLDALPVAGEPIAVLARRLLGDAHGLDTARPLGRLATAATSMMFELPGDTRREVWAAVGVVLSTVSSTVLSLGVPGAGSSGVLVADATSAALSAMRDARMPMVLTLDQVRSGGVAPLGADAVVHVCENPTVVEVAAQHWSADADHGGPRPVLVCTNGQPSVAVVELLTVLTATGAQCRYHGDFDWGGLRIAGALRRRVAWAPWRYTSADYVQAVQADASGARRLTGTPAASPWEPELAAVMAEHGLAVEEEAVADVLVADLLTPR